MWEGLFLLKKASSMWPKHPNSAGPLAFCLLIISFSSHAAPTSRNDTTLEIPSDKSYQSSALTLIDSTPLMFEGSQTAVSALVERRVRNQYLPGGILVQYVRFNVFARTLDTYIYLTYFWASLDLATRSAPEEVFKQAIFTYGLGVLRLEVFNMEGTIPRNAVLALASVMANYTERGFCGVFNARITVAGKALWVTMKVVPGHLLPFPGR